MIINYNQYNSIYWEYSHLDNLLNKVECNCNIPETKAK